MLIAFVLAVGPHVANADGAPAPTATATATAVPTANANVEAKVAEAPFPLKANVSFTNAVGSGTFNTAPFNPTIESALTLAPRVRVGDFGIGLRQAFAIEWTDSDSATYPRQLSMSDLQITGSYAKLKLEDLGLGFNFGAGLDVPLAMVSRNLGKVTSLRGSAGANWTHSSGFNAGLNVNAGYNVVVAGFGQRFASQPGRPYEDRQLGSTVPATCIIRSPEELDNFACAGGAPTIAAFATTLNAGYSILEGALSFNGVLGYAASTTGFAPNDEFTAARASTLPVARQSWSADLSASYTVTPWFVVTGGANSGPPVLTSLANNGLRTPFFDFFTAERYRNFSSIYVDTSFTF